MKKSLIWFSAIYGELTSIVIGVVLIGYLWETSRGMALCEMTGLSLFACKSISISLFLLGSSVGLVYTFKKFIREVKNKKNELNE